MQGLLDHRYDGNAGWAAFGIGAVLCACLALTSGQEPLRTRSRKLWPFLAICVLFLAVAVYEVSTH